MTLYDALSPLVYAVATSVAADSARASPLLASDDFGGLTVFFWIVWLFIRFITNSPSAPASQPKPPAGPPPPPPAPGGYAIPCPVCGERDIQEARRLEVLRGRGLWPRVEVQTIIGCAPCVRRLGRRVLLQNLASDWQTVGGFLATPYMLVRTVRRMYVAPSAELTEELIRGAGLDPAEAILNTNGITTAQQRMVVAAATVFSRIIWADRSLALKTHQRAVQALRRLTQGRLSNDRAASILEWTRFQPLDRSKLSRALCGTIFRMLREVAIAEGSLTRQRLSMVYLVAGWLGHTAKDVKDLLGAFAWAPPDPTAEDPGARQHAHGHGQRSDGYYRQYRNDEYRNRYSAPIQNDVAVARAVLGVSATAPYAEIQTAYRILVSRNHPDRAGLDPLKVKERTRKTQELTWAMGILRRAMSRGMS